MSTPPRFVSTQVDRAFAALRKDLVHENGPRISTMRNYRFAILQYLPKQEFEVRVETQRLVTELKESGWVVVPIDLHKLFLDRIRAKGDEWVARLVAMERRVTDIQVERGVNHLKTMLTPLVEGAGGIAADCSRIICDYASRHPDKAERTLAIIGRAGALYPFYRSSALLRHLDGRTQNVPVVLLYPGERRGKTSLSFMGIIEPDRDYRPRIYP